MSGDNDLDRLLDALPGNSLDGPPPPPASMSDAVFDGMDMLVVARDFARGIHPKAVVATRHGMTPEQAILLCSQPVFRRMVQRERAVWEGSDNAGERARQYHREGQAMVASEIVGMVLDDKLPAALRLDAAKFSAKVAGIDAPPKQPGADGPAGTSFSVSIHLGEGKVERLTTTVAAPVIEHDEEGDGP